MDILSVAAIKLACTVCGGHYETYCFLMNCSTRGARSLRKRSVPLLFKEGCLRKSRSKRLNKRGSAWKREQARAAENLC